MVSVRGSCLCGAVAWQAEGPFELMHHCHCSMCRKFHGSTFATLVAAPEKGFRWLRGEDGVASYASSAALLRPFCAACGSPVPGGAEDGRIFMPAGCLDDDPGERAVAHIFAASKAPWHEISDELPTFDAYPPGFGEAPEPAAREEVAASGAAASGSCLCGAVAYELDGPLALMVNCHCTRCRKGRGAAHSTQLLATAGALRWIRGEEKLRSHRVPGAEYFRNPFCETCGSVMPVVHPAIDRSVVPVGSLDGDPGARPGLHIFVGTKAPWHEISDGLPTFEESPPG